MYPWYMYCIFRYRVLCGKGDLVGVTFVDGE